MRLANRHTQTTSAASQKDLLQVQSGTAAVPAAPAALLARMGFRISQPAPDHWVLTGSKPLPELHFYSLTELGRFAVRGAHHYRNQPHHLTDQETAT